MESWRFGAAIVTAALGLFLAPAIGQERTPRSLLPVWSQTLPSDLTSFIVSSDGGCIVAATGSRVFVFDRAGGPLWDFELERGQVYFDSNLAVSKTCDRVVAQSSATEIHNRDGTKFLVDFGDSFKGGLHSFAISPNKQFLAIGTERGLLLVADERGQILRRIQVDSLADNSIEVEFTPDGNNIVVTGWFETGLVTPDGEWRWHRSVDFRRAYPSADASIYAAEFAPAHGPQGGDVAILDAAGKTIWKRFVWNPSTAISPDGSFIAFSNLNVPANEMPGNRPGNERPEIWVVDPKGHEIAHKDLPGWVEAISRDNRCVFTREILVPGAGRADLVAYDRKLNEAWRFERGYSSMTRSKLFARANLFVTGGGGMLRVYELPSCSEK